MAASSDGKAASRSTTQAESAVESGGFFSWLMGSFSSSSEARAAKEAELRAKADAKSKDLAAAIAAAKDEKEKTALQDEAKKHAEREIARRAAADERAKRDAERQAAREAELKAKEEARSKAASDRKAKEAQELKAREERAAKEAAEKKALMDERAKRDAERQAAREAELKAKEEARSKAEQERKSMAEQKAKDAAAEKAAKEAELKAKIEREEQVQAQRAAALIAKLKAREEARALSEAEAKAMAEQELKARVESVASAAAERKAYEESRVNKELEKRAVRESSVRARMDARAKELANAIVEVADPEEKARLRKESDDLAAREAARREAVAVRDADLRARWETRSKALDERAKFDMERAAQTVERSKWRLSAGAVYRVINSQTFKSGSYSQSHPIPAKARTTSYTYDPASDTTALADRDYIDGYVHMDDWTGLDGGTWNWGYDEGSQVVDGALVLKWLQKSRTDFTRNTSITSSDRERDSDENVGVYVRAERVLKQVGPLDYGVRVDASRVSYSSSGNDMTFSDRQQWSSYRQYTEDSYSLAGTGITPASTPYQGTLETPGPSINNTPDSRVSGKGNKVSSGSYEAYNSVEESLSMDLSTISLGMSLAGHYSRLYVAGSTGPTLTIVDTDASYYEALYESSNGGPSSLLASWRDSKRDTEYNVGYFVQGELGLRLIRGLEISIFGRYDWIENISGSVGQMRYVANPEGGSVGGTLNYAF